MEVAHRTGMLSRGEGISAGACRLVLQSPMLDQKLLFYTPTLELTPQIHSRFHTYSPLVL